MLPFAMLPPGTFLAPWLAFALDTYKTLMGLEGQLVHIVLGAHIALAPAVWLGFGLFSRLAPADMAQQSTRARLRDLIHERPGIGLTDLVALADIGWGNVVYHLNRLEAAKLVHSETVGRRRAFFVPEHGVQVRDDARRFCHPTKRRLMEELQRDHGQSQAQLARRVGISVSLAHRDLWQLEHEGLARSERTGRERLYSPGVGLSEYLAALERGAGKLGASAMMGHIVREESGAGLADAVSERVLPADAASLVKRVALPGRGTTAAQPTAQLEDGFLVVAASRIL